MKLSKITHRRELRIRVDLHTFHDSHFSIFLDLSKIISTFENYL